MRRRWGSVTVVHRTVSLPSALHCILLWSLPRLFPYAARGLALSFVPSSQPTVSSTLTPGRRLKSSLMPCSCDVGTTVHGFPPECERSATLRVTLGGGCLPGPPCATASRSGCGGGGELVTPLEGDRRGLLPFPGQPLMAASVRPGCFVPHPPQQDVHAATLPTLPSWHIRSDARKAIGQGRCGSTPYIVARRSRALLCGPPSLAPSPPQ